MAALRTILDVTRSTSRKNIAVRISEKNGPVLLIGMTTETTQTRKRSPTRKTQRESMSCRVNYVMLKNRLELINSP